MERADLSLGHFACLDGFDGDPHTFYLSAGELDANALHIGAEATLSIFDQAGTNTATFFSETFTDDATALDGAFACDCADTCHV